MNALRSPDEYVLALPAALRFVDGSDLGDIYDSLDVELVQKANPANRCTMEPTRSGRWVAHRLPGLPVDIANDPSSWPANIADYEVRLSDHSGRFLAMRCDIELPAQGTQIWAHWGSPPEARIRPLLKVGQNTPDYIPLFGAPGRSYSVPVARVAAHLAIRNPDGSDRPASWAMLRIRSGNSTVGIGRADVNGNVEVAFPYPELPSMSPAEAAAGRQQVSWTLRIAVHFDDLPASGTIANEPAPPLLADLFDQLSGTANRAFNRLGQNQPFANPELVLGERLVLRTEDGPNSYHSSLYIEAS